MLTLKENIRLIAFYLPQFHPVPENDVWWGKGFTEWTNVTKAKPLFRGHHQPHLPADLGFYDLRLPEARQAQADLAREYGIHGFCYYHYWFNGKRLLERPFNEVLASGKPDFPFCLCWANETWSRRWLGEERDILLAQTYSERDDEKHVHWLVEAFSDSRYICVEGRPLFLIYRPDDLPDPHRLTQLLRERCLQIGLKSPYLVGVDARNRGFDYRRLGFDSTLRFEPQLGVLPTAFHDHPTKRKLIQNLRLGIFSSRLKVFNYQEARQTMQDGIQRSTLRDIFAQLWRGRQSMQDGIQRESFPLIPSVFVSWDNAARSGSNGVIMVDSSPEAFGTELRKTAQHVKNRLDDGINSDLLFINAWNEWAEGNHLEPDQKFGKSYLEQVRRVLNEIRVER